MSAVMNVPDGWETTELNNIVTNKTKKADITDRLPIIDLEHIEQRTGKLILNSWSRDYPKDKVKFVPGDILFGKLRPYLEKFWFASLEGASTSELLVMEAKKDIDKQFIFYVIHTSRFMAHANRYAYGTKMPRVSFNDLKSYQLMIPKSSEEQQRIAKILSTLDQAIEGSQKLIVKEKNIKKGLMYDLLSNGIDENGKIRTPKTHNYKDSELGLIPEGWATTTLGETAKFNAGYAFKNDELAEFGMKVVRISNLHKISFPYWFYDGKIKATWLVEEGDLLFSWAGVASSIDCVKYQGEMALLNQHIYNLKINNKTIKEFTFQYLQFHLPKLREEIEGGAGQLHLTKSKIESILFPEMNIIEKEHIVQLFVAQDKKIETEEQNLAKLKELKKGLMSDLLSGTVRV